MLLNVIYFGLNSCYMVKLNYVHIIAASFLG